MSEVILFNHIPKTAGTTMHRVLQRAVGEERIRYSTVLGEHRERLEEIAAELALPGNEVRAVVAHTGVGVEELLPPGHTYSRFTVLRDPVARTISNYFHMYDHGTDGEPPSFERFLAEQPLHSFNVQTAFLGGATARAHLGEAELTPAAVDRGTLAAAQEALAAHQVVGLTERFDETLLLLRREYGWRSTQTLYLSANVGRARKVARLSAAELELAAAANELDRELFEFAGEIAAERLARAGRGAGGDLARFRRLNGFYRRGHELVGPWKRGVAVGARRPA
jgi:hypothetical protein